MTVDTRFFAAGPARDARFRVGEIRAEMENFDAAHPEATREFLHRQMNEEINGMEISARNLADFPDAPWELRMAMARQCWDESRHIEMFRRCFEARGGQVGQYPVMNFQYRILMNIDTLIGRLTVQNRSFEAAGIDAIQNEILETARNGGQHDLLDLFDAQLADEVQHVRYANRWIPRLRELGGARSVLDIARATAQAAEALTIIAGDALLTYPVAEDVRREAGFDDAEIATAKELAASPRPT
ncbi:MAG TPA: DUF455 family protein [Thermoanaerobaculia bacterium]|nr:DUF455 family protein [Thermoanaerobaculia bacterium]